MPEVTINYLAVLVTAVASMAVGSIVYGPLLGKKWQQMIGKTDEELQKGAGKAMGIAFVASLVGAFVLAHVVDFMDAATWMDGVKAGLLMWFGFTAVAMVTNNAFEGRKWGLVWIFLLNAGLTLAAQGAILAAWV